MREYQTWGARKPHRHDWRAGSGEIVVWIAAAIAAAGLVFMKEGAGSDGKRDYYVLSIGEIFNIEVKCE